MFDIFLLFVGAMSLMEGVAAEWHGRRKKAAILIIGGVVAALYAVNQIHQSVLANLPH